MVSQGAQANRTGKLLESIVQGALSQRSFEVVQFSTYIKTPAEFGEELLLKNVPYVSIYGTKGYTEFLLKSKKYELDVRIECKWQQTSGSADEKLVYTYLNCVYAIPEDNVVILIDGDGFRPGAKQWLKDAAGAGLYLPQNSSKSINVFSSTEFLTWVNNTLRTK